MNLLTKPSKTKSKIKQTRKDLVNIVNSNK